MSRLYGKTYLGQRPTKKLQRLNMVLSLSDTLKATVLCLLVILSFLSNAFVLIVLVSKERRLLRRPLYLFILNLCASDLIACLFTMTFEVSEDFLHRWQYGQVGCKIIECLEVLLFGVNIFNHLSIAFDRYQNVVYPLKPPMRIQTAKKLLLGSWCFPTVMALPYLYTFELKKEGEDDICVAISWSVKWLDKLYGTVELLCIFLVPLVCLLWMYFAIVKTLYLRAKQSNNVNASSHHGSTIRAAASYGSRVSIVVVSVFVICWLPYIVIFTVRLVTKPENVERTSTLYVTALYFSYTNELLSPVIYCVFDRNIRPAFLRIFRCPFGRRVTVGNLSQNEPLPGNTSRNETLEDRTECDAVNRQNTS